MKRILALLLIIVAIFSGCSNTDVVNVNIEIDITDILSNYEMLDESLRDEKYVPKNGKILEATEIAVNEGDGALEALQAVAKEKDILIDVSGGYAKGINHIYEKSCGAMSGWVYEVNGEAVMSEYFVSEGDTITWKYICDFSTFTE